ncbi:MAG: isoprenylcysteine carboxyl methyltransferase family protein [Deltaproteobacteria bacterium]|nr:isoprenylcysteine carboxyl methyltransferase family protein [Deltaproteobacteria bacterium]
MVTPLHVYTVLVVVFALERVVELVLSKRHAKAMLARGAVEEGKEHYPVMVVLHTAFLLGCLLEPWLLDRPFVPALGIPMAIVAVLSQSLRWWAITTLGEHWNTRVIVLPGAPRITGGPYRFFSHPNYVAVVAEGVALPLVHSAWSTALLFTLANAALLFVRIRVEDRALEAAA